MREKNLNNQRNRLHTTQTQTSEYVPRPTPKYTYKGGLYREPLIPGRLILLFIFKYDGWGRWNNDQRKMATLQLKGFSGTKDGQYHWCRVSGRSYILKMENFTTEKIKL